MDEEASEPSMAHVEETAEATEINVDSTVRTPRRRFDITDDVLSRTPPLITTTQSEDNFPELKRYTSRSRSPSPASVKSRRSVHSVDYKSSDISPTLERSRQGKAAHRALERDLSPLYASSDFSATSPPSRTSFDSLRTTVDGRHAFLPPNLDASITIDDSGIDKEQGTESDSTRSFTNNFTTHVAAKSSLSHSGSDAFYKTMKIHIPQPVGNMSISPTSRDIVLAARKGLFIIDLENPYEPPRFIRHLSNWEVADVQWNPHVARQEWVASTSNQKGLVWNLRNAQSQPIEHILHAHTRAISDINWSLHHQDILATCSIDSYVYLWDLRTNTPAIGIDNTRNGNMSDFVNGNGESRRQPTHAFCPWGGGATQVKFNRKNDFLLASSHDRNILIWDTRKGSSPVVSIAAHDTKIYGIDWSRTNDYEIVSCSLDRLVKFWNIHEPNDCTKTIETKSPVWRARHTPFGNGILTMPQRLETTLSLWNPDESDKPVHTFTGHTDAVKEFVWRARDSSTEGTEFQLVSWAKDQYLRLWPIDQDMMKAVKQQPGQAKPYLRVSSETTNQKTTPAATFSFRDPEVIPKKPTQMPSTIRVLSDPLVPTLASLQQNRLGVGQQFLDTGITVQNQQHWNMSTLLWMQNVNTVTPMGLSMEDDKYGETEQSFTNLAEEITYMIKKYDGTVKFEHVDLAARTCTMSLQSNGPDSGYAFMRITVAFAPEYPTNGQATFYIQKNTMLSMYTRAHMTRDLNLLASNNASQKKSSLEPAIKFLLGESVYDDSEKHEDGVSTPALNVPGAPSTPFASWSNDPLAFGLAKASADSDEDTFVGSPLMFNGGLLGNRQSFGSDTDKALVDMSLLENKTHSVPFPRLCGATFSSTGQLVYFFSSLQIKPHSSPSRPPSVIQSSPQRWSLVRSVSTDALELFQHPQSYSQFADFRDAVYTARAREEGGYGSYDEDDMEEQEDVSDITSIMYFRRQNSTRRRAGWANAPLSIYQGRLSPDSRPIGMQDMSHLMPFQPSLAAEYKITGQSAYKVCLHNANVAKKHGRHDMSYVWLLAAEIVREILPGSEQHDKGLRAATLFGAVSKSMLRTSLRVNWGAHPLGRKLVDSIMQHFTRLLDVQTLAILSCVFHEVFPAEQAAVQEAILPIQNSEMLMRKQRRNPIDYFSPQYASHAEAYSLGNAKAITPGLRSLSSPLWDRLSSIPISTAAAFALSSSRDKAASLSNADPTSYSQDFLYTKPYSVDSSGFDPYGGSTTDSYAKAAQAAQTRVSFHCDTGNPEDDVPGQLSRKQTKLKVTLNMDDLQVECYDLEAPEEDSILWSPQVIPLLDPRRSAQYDAFRYTYADYLYRLGLFDLRAEILKFMDSVQAYEPPKMKEPHPMKRLAPTTKLFAHGAPSPRELSRSPSINVSQSDNASLLPPSDPVEALFGIKEDYLDIVIACPECVHFLTNPFNMKLRLFTIASIALAYGLSAVDAQTTETKVAILGGGVSAVAAAEALVKDYGVEDFVIIEARDELGGRAQDYHFANTTIERGCNWIQGLGKNPIYQLAKKWGLKNIPQDYSSLVTYDTNGKVNDTTMMNTYENYFAEAGKYAAQRQKQNRADLTVRAGYHILGWQPTNPVEEIYEYYNIDFETAEPPEICSLYNAMSNTAGGFSPGNNLVLDPRGFKYIFQQEAYSFLKGGAKDPRLHFNTTVKTVQWTQDNVTITTNKGTFEADYAISTFSVGVLQHTDVKWKPALPEWKLEGIYAFDMATYAKIFLNFPTIFWDSEQYTLWADPDVRGRYGVWQNLNAPGFLPQNTSTNIFFVTVTDTEALRVGAMTDDEVKNEIMVLLRSIYGNHIPDPTDFYFPRWHKDPLYRGTYSNWPVGELNQHHDNMRAPLLNRLFFTGEAMSKAYFGFLQGAWIEGNATGHSVGNCLQGQCDSYDYHTAIDTCSQKANQGTEIVHGIVTADLIEQIEEASNHQSPEQDYMVDKFTVQQINLSMQRLNSLLLVSDRSSDGSFVSGIALLAESSILRFLILDTVDTSKDFIHLFKRYSFGLLNEEPGTNGHDDVDGNKDIEGLVAEVSVHGGESGTKDKGANILELRSNTNHLSTDVERKDLNCPNPDRGTPRGTETEVEQENGNCGEDGSRKVVTNVLLTNTDRYGSGDKQHGTHPDGTPEQGKATAKLVNPENGNHCANDLNDILDTGHDESNGRRVESSGVDEGAKTLGKSAIFEEIEETDLGGVLLFPTDGFNNLVVLLVNVIASSTETGRNQMEKATKEGMTICINTTTRHCQLSSVQETKDSIIDFALRGHSHALLDTVSDSIPATSGPPRVPAVKNNDRRSIQVARSERDEQKDQFPNRDVYASATMSRSSPIFQEVYALESSSSLSLPSQLSIKSPSDAELESLEDGETTPLNVLIAEEEEGLLSNEVDLYPEANIKLPKDGGTIFASFLNMANSIIGAGIIGLPYAFREAGLLTGILLLVSLTWLVDWTVELLMHSGKLSGRATYQDLVTFCFGRPGLIVISIFQFIFAYGAMCAYSVILGDTVPHVIVFLFPSITNIPVLSLFTSRQFVILFCTLAVSYPLSLYRDISKLAAASAFALVTIVIIILSVVIEGPRMPAELKGGGIGGDLFIGSRVFEAIGVISFAFVCHHNSFIIFGSLKKPSLNRFATVTHLSMLISLLSCIIMALSGYLVFTDQTRANILNNFPQNNLIINISRFCFGLNMFTTLPLETFVCREVIENYFWAEQAFSTKRHFIITTGLILSALLIALATCNLGFVLELTGGCSATVLAFILPPACWLKLNASPQPFKRMACMACIVVGVVVMVLSTGLSVVRAIRAPAESNTC
ncbi:hypothetical protein BZG36_04083 [Bifiguratus adelaidae]|uniref:Uncharacterized protein n=1 Tax=Bifiguratus adelaidae TaxID=1938954 RepID=A0A261XWY1_9FUNG|nr:hypothetical protein BZG36_04083 [Bifiguratus adelaidae]